MRFLSDTSTSLMPPSLNVLCLLLLQVYLGCMLPNLLGTEFRQLDHRVDPRDSAKMEYVKDKGKNELFAVVYEPNVMGRRVRGSWGGIFGG